MDILLGLFFVAFAALFFMAMVTAFVVLFNILRVALGFEVEWINKFWKQKEYRE